MDRCGNSGENVGEEKESVERRSAKRKRNGRQDKKKEYQSGRQGRKVARHSCFTVFCGSGRSKSRLAKPAGAEPSGRRRDQNCTPLWREADFEVKMLKTPHCRSSFGR